MGKPCGAFLCDNVLMKIVLPITESDLENNYDAIMPEIDALSLKRRSIIWKAWTDLLKHAGTWECLKDFHVMLFGGLFDFAGKLRTKNISKGGFRFANALFLDSIIPLIANMPQKNFNEILGKYIEMNIAHPFREGNGRTLRLWLDSILQHELNTRINWQKISRSDYLSAMQRSPVNSLELEVLLKNSMISPEALNDKNIFMASLSASYSYEKM